LFLSAGILGDISSRVRKVLNFSPLAFADKALEDAFILAQQAFGHSVGLAIYALLSMFTVIFLCISCTDRYDVVHISHLGFTLIALLLLLTRQEFMMKYSQVRRELILYFSM
jgi:hypothetical protein